MTIQSFRHRGLQLFFTTGNTRRLPVQQFANRVRLVLLALDAATGRADLVNNPGLHYHGLGEMDPGRYSLRVTGNWRITFSWQDEQPAEVDIQDYH
ncbi:MAG: type II toxin-antitoxin system RelE/ParE family toxin [Phenylobacterium sp.]|nr:type II toxin-antitoxin system RelE/ParE family toxin [Phenylobacterium sp.]